MKELHWWPKIIRDTAGTEKIRRPRDMCCPLVLTYVFVPKNQKTKRHVLSPGAHLCVCTHRSEGQETYAVPWCSLMCLYPQVRRPRNMCCPLVLTYVFVPIGQKAKRHVLSPGDEESEPDEQDGVVALEWDPLSTEYLLVANNHSGIRLLDTDSLSTITSFQMPSAAATVHTLSWIPSAPGMFATGGKEAFTLSNSEYKNEQFLLHLLFPNMNRKLNLTSTRLVMKSLSCLLSVSVNYSWKHSWQLFWKVEGSKNYHFHQFIDAYFI